MISLFHQRPKTLGEGLKRIVNKAGKTKDAVLLESSVPGERVYSNGVRIVRQENLSQPKSPEQGLYQYATYVFKNSEKKVGEEAAKDIYAVKGRKTVFTENAGKLEEVFDEVDKAIGNREKFMMLSPGQTSGGYMSGSMFDLGLINEYARRLK